MRKQDVSDMTKHELARALFDLMMEKPLDKITVTELVAACDFPRSTFYYHAHDVYEFASWAIADVMMSFLLEGAKQGEGWHGALLNLFRRCKANPTIGRNACDSREIWRLAQGFSSYSLDIIMPTVQLLYPDLDYSDGTMRRVMACYGHSVFSEMMNWVRRGMTQSPEQMTMFMETVLFDNMDATIKHCSSPEFKMVLAGAYDAQDWK